MVSKAGNCVLNLVHPPIDNMVLLQGAFDDVVIGSHVPNVGFFTEVTDVGVASPSSINAQLVGAASTGLLIPVFVGSGLTLTGGVLSVTSGPPPPPGPGPSPGPSPGVYYSRRSYGSGRYSF